MPPTTRKPAAKPVTVDQAPDDVDQDVTGDVDQDVDQAPELRAFTTSAESPEQARIRDLERQLAAAQAVNQPAPAPEPADLPPTHVLRLADGSTVETNSPVATLHTTEDGDVLPVVGAYEIRRGE